MSNQQIVDFDYEEFIQEYPEFSTFTQTQLQNFFDIATGILNNTYSTPVCDKDKLKRMLYLLTAHIAFLHKRGMGVVGVLSGATEGSVSTNFAVPTNQNAQWYLQSGYGQLFWQMSLPYRLGKYVAYVGC